MIPAVELIAAIRSAREIAAFIDGLIQLGRQSGAYTDEQIAEIEREAEVSRDAWDRRQADARRRLAEGGERS